jgi:hypothetical protein
LLHPLATPITVILTLSDAEHDGLMSSAEGSGQELGPIWERQVGDMQEQTASASAVSVGSSGARTTPRQRRCTVRIDG